jgi:hypothetical protein
VSEPSQVEIGNDWTLRRINSCALFWCPELLTGDRKQKVRIQTCPDPLELPNSGACASTIRDKGGCGAFWLARLRATSFDRSSSDVIGGCWAHSLHIQAIATTRLTECHQKQLSSRLPSPQHFQRLSHRLTVLPPF